MSSKPPGSRWRGQAESNGVHIDNSRTQRPVDLNRPLPAPPSSLPSEYEIPSLRRKPPIETAPVNPLGHSRSISHPFPAFFGGKRQEKRAQPRQDMADSSDDGVQPTKSSRKIPKGPKVLGYKSANKQPVTGRCITCDSAVRWPQDLKTFRCTTCLTINDLEPAEANADSANGFSASSKPRLFVSVERTRRIIDLCLDDFFQRTLSDSKACPEKQKSPATETCLLSDEEPLELDIRHGPNVVDAADHNVSLSSPRLRFQDRSPSDSVLSLRRPSRPEDQPAAAPPPIPPHYLEDKRVPNEVQSFRPRLQSMEPDIFRSVESYVASCFTGCAALNISFFSPKPPSNPHERQHHPRHARQQLSENVETPISEPEVFLSELDAKTLLLGDVVENGSWWTGKVDDRANGISADSTRERSPERARAVVSARNPRINWLELAEWYRLILHAGDDWRKRWLSLKTTLSGIKLEKWQAVSMEALHRHVIDSQIHLQRSLLKATENLLKRPRRPLTSPDDCRFLLMLLANPLLLPSAKAGAPRSTRAKPEAAKHAPPGSPLRSATLPKRNLSGLGRHSGIVKRILGLIAHLSNDIHIYLISWFSRFSDAHFADLVEIVGSFVTYRLTRQMNKPTQEVVDPTEGLIPSFTDGGARHASQVHAALGSRSQAAQKQKDKQKQDAKSKFGNYSEDWQLRAAARTMALLFQANSGHNVRKRDTSISPQQRAYSAGLNAKHQAHMHGQMIPISTFYNSMLDHADLVADFEAWETTKTKFTFCQYPFFLSIWAKIHILEHDARKQMDNMAREAFFDSILSRKAVSQYLVLKVRRDCLVDDSLKSVSEAIGRGGSDVKKGLRIDFVGEEGVDAGGLRKEWFLLLVREVFNPNHGLFTYDEESQYCYFNPYCFESSEQFFLVGVLLGLAIYNSTILDIAFPPFVFKKMLASAPPMSDKLTSVPKISYQYSLEDLAELKPSLARGLRQLLDFEGDVQEVFCRDFMVETERYGGVVQVPLCPGGADRPVTNANRREFVDLYLHYLLDQSVARQYEPFKRGFFTVCGGNALSLFRPEEIELLIRGSDEPLDVSSLQVVASYDGWPKEVAPEEQPQVLWFWEFFGKLQPQDQRNMLSFITGSDRIPAMGATNLSIRVQLLLDKEASEMGVESQRLPIARTCFNLIGLYPYQDRKTFEQKLWTAVTLSEGFGMK